MEELVIWILNSATKVLWEVLGQPHLCGGDMLAYKREPLELLTEVPFAGD
jgi:hypothetical protein